MWHTGKPKHLKKPLRLRISTHSWFFHFFQGRHLIAALCAARSIRGKSIWPIICVRTQTTHHSVNVANQRNPNWIVRSNILFSISGCEICGKCFTRKEHFTNHILWHTGETPHRFDITSNQFIRSFIHYSFLFKFPQMWLLFENIYAQRVSFFNFIHFLRVFFYNFVSFSLVDIFWIMCANILTSRRIVALIGELDDEWLRVLRASNWPIIISAWRRLLARNT